MVLAGNHAWKPTNPLVPKYACMNLRLVQEAEMVHVRFGIWSAALALALTASTGALAIPTVQTYAVTTSALGADNPAIWGNYVVWQAVGPGGTDIFAGVLGTGDLPTSSILTVCTSAGTQSMPTVGQGFVAWEDRRTDSNGNIVAASANWGTGTFTSFNVATRSGAEIAPCINGDILFYNYNASSYNPNTVYTIAAYDLASRTALLNVASSSAAKGPAAASSSYVVWHDARAGTGNRDIWGYNRSSHGSVQITSFAGSQLYPAIFGNMVAWTELIGGYYKVGFMEVGGAVTYVPGGSFDMQAPSIYGDFIVWADNRNGNWDVYAYQISTGEQFLVAGGAGDQDKPKIFADKIVFRTVSGMTTQINYAVLSAAAPAVPEPSSLAALLSGVLAAAGIIRRRSR